MTTSPFHNIPSQSFWVRMAVPAVLIFLLSFYCVHFYFSTVPLSFPFSGGTVQVDPDLSSSLKQIPSHCINGETVNDVQVLQCRRIWVKLAVTIGIQFIPILPVLIFLILMQSLFRSVYRRAQMRFEKKKMVFTGIVTHPPRAPRDGFSWCFCLEPIMLELADRRQMKVYIPFGADIPDPGQKLAVLEPFEVFGEKRYFALSYTPHIAIVRGA